MDKNMTIAELQELIYALREVQIMCAGKGWCAHCILHYYDKTPCMINCIRPSHWEIDNPVHFDNEHEHTSVDTVDLKEKQIEALNTIKRECEKHGDGECDKCPMGASKWQCRLLDTSHKPCDVRINDPYKITKALVEKIYSWE